jgi:hypothetical protein
VTHFEYARRLAAHLGLDERLVLRGSAGAPAGVGSLPDASLSTAGSQRRLRTRLLGIAEHLERLFPDAVAADRAGEP